MVQWKEKPVSAIYMRLHWEPRFPRNRLETWLKTVIMKWFSLCNSPSVLNPSLDHHDSSRRPGFYLKQIRTCCNICGSVSHLSVGKMANLRLAGGRWGGHCQRKSRFHLVGWRQVACEWDRLQFGFWQMAVADFAHHTWTRLTRQAGRLSRVCGESNIWCEFCRQASTGQTARKKYQLMQEQQSSSSPRITYTE